VRPGRWPAWLGSGRLPEEKGDGQGRSALAAPVRNVKEDTDTPRRGRVIGSDMRNTQVSLLVECF
jgi:hypothetical protein